MAREPNQEELMRLLGIQLGTPVARAEDINQVQMEDIPEPIPPSMPTPQQPEIQPVGMSAPKESPLARQLAKQEYEQLQQRAGDVSLDRAALSQEAGKSGFEKMDLTPVMQLAALAGGTSPALSMYKAPKDKTADLRSQLERSQSGLSTAQNSYLRNMLEKQNAQSDRNQLMQQRLTMNYAEKMGKDLDPYAAPRTTAFGRAGSSMQAADKLMVLAEQVPDLNFSRNQMVELATSTANLLSSGSQTAQSQIEHLLPRTVDRSAAGIFDWVFSEPHGAGQMEFARQMLDTAARERDLAAKQIYETQKNRLTKYQGLKKSSPSDFDLIKSQFVVEPSETAHKFSAVNDKKFKKEIAAGGKKAIATPKAMNEDEFIKKFLEAKKNAQ